MKNNQLVSKILAAFGGAALAGILVASGMPAAAEADQENVPEAARCTDRTIRGDYGFSIDGTIFAGTPNAVLLRAVAMTHFDGEGNLSQVDFATRNGVPTTSDWRPAVGTYAINPDCTGTAEIVPSDGTPTLHLRLVVVDHGRQIRTIVAGNATGSIGIRTN